MVGRPTLIAALLAMCGAGALLVLGEALPPTHYGSAILGAVCASVTTHVLLRELKRRDRVSISIGVGMLGFLAGAAAATGAYPWPLGFAGAYVPALLLFFAGVGRERLFLELERLEGEADDAAARPRVLRRVMSIRDSARKAARAIDPDADEEAFHAGDARAIYAYAAQVAGYLLSLEGRYDEAIAALSEVPMPWMPKPLRPFMMSNLSCWHLCAGDLEGARRTIDQAPEDGTEPEVRPILRGTRAAVLVREGDAEAALDLIGRKDGELGEPPIVTQRYRITRAHAFAAQGEIEAARAEIQRVIEDGEIEELRRWLPAGGPAIKEMDALLHASRKKAKRKARAKAEADAEADAERS